MKKIGLLSDTHSFLDPQVYEYFKNTDEIWHAGDFGNIKLSDDLAAFKKLRGVYGNIDGDNIRKVHPLHNRFIVEDVDVWMTHIGGYPGRYSQNVRDAIKLNPPDLFITGHSHILKVMRDKNLNNMLHINPGAAGKEGFHKVRTAIRFTIDKSLIKDLEIIELGTR